MKSEKYIRPESEIVVLGHDSELCVKGSGSNEDYNVNNFNWSKL